MKQFNTVFRGYNKEEVHEFINETIYKLEGIIAEVDKKDQEVARLYEKIKDYEEREANLNRALVMAENTSEQIRRMAKTEADLVVEEAKNNANRIINESLLRAEKTELEAHMLRKNVSVFKKRLRSIIESQLELVDEIEKVDF